MKESWFGANKTCSLCHIEKPRSEFYFSPARGSEVGRCRACYKLRVRSGAQKERPLRMPAPEHKTCITCKLDLPIAMFSPSDYRSDGHLNRCKSCFSRSRSKTSRQYAYKHRYGITIEEFNRMVAGQNGLCAICLAPAKNGRNLFVDHCHKTGALRGLLCSECNLGIGSLKDSRDVLLNAAKYLEGYA